MEGWKEVQIMDIAKRMTSGGTPSTKRSEYYGGGIPWLNTKEINFNRIISTERTITQLGLEKSSAKLINKNSVIVAMYGATAAKSAINKIPLTTNQACCNITLDEDKADYEYVYYRLCKDYKKLSFTTVGAAQQNLSVGRIGEFKIPLPPLPEQRAIASVLSSLDDKIDLLHRQNQTLEEMAETLFRQWFVEEAEEERRIGYLGEYVKKTVGGAWGKENPEGDYIQEVNCIRGTDIGDLETGLAIKSPIRFIKEKKFKKVNPIEGDLIIEISGGTEGQSTGRVCYITNEMMELFDKPLIFSNFCRLIRPTSPELMFFIYGYINYLYDKGHFFNLQNGSSGIRNLDYKGFLNDYPLFFPKNETLMRKYSDTVSGYFLKINRNKKQIQTLTQLRDTLLPKLMSGEVRVKQ